MIGFLLNNNLAPIGSSVISTCSPADLFEQRERNVPLASADVRGGERLPDEPKEHLCRRLTLTEQNYYLYQVIRRGSRGGEMGEFSPPPPLFLNHADAQTSNTSTRLWF